MDLESSAVGVTPYLLNTEYHTTLCESATHGLSGYRQILSASDTHQTDAQLSYNWQVVSNRHLYLFLLVSPPQS